MMRDWLRARRGEPLPPELAEVGRALADVRFSPRESLGPELSGRARRGEPPKGDSRPRRFLRGRGGLVAGGLAITAALAGAAIWVRARPQPAPHRAALVDSCCRDLDGGGKADDGVLVHRVGDRLLSLEIYEDRDHSGDYSLADTVRFSRRGTLSLPAALRERLAPFTTCCADLDGQGVDDDGVLVLGAHGHIVLAALFEQPPVPPVAGAQPLPAAGAVADARPQPGAAGVTVTPAGAHLDGPGGSAVTPVGATLAAPRAAGTVVTPR